MELLRTTIAGGRSATILRDDTFRVVVEDRGGMVSELSNRSCLGGRVNAHWIPWYRGSAAHSLADEPNKEFWGEGEISYIAAGNYLCTPNFGPPHRDGSVVHTTHGWAPISLWKYERSGKDEEQNAIYSIMSLRSPQKEYPLSLTRIDAVFEGNPVHYVTCMYANDSDDDLEINAAWHNTLGGPFLREGCVVSMSAREYVTEARGSEFEKTGRLAIEERFDDLMKTPLRNGGICDVSIVPGIIGYSDFIMGPVPRRNVLGWQAVVNPVAKLAYIPFFKGPAAIRGDEIGLDFNLLWMEYGGRDFTPWAAYEGGTDLNFCLGTENGVCFFAEGLALAKKKKNYMGSPTTVVIPKRAVRFLRYATMLVPYTGDDLSRGIADIEIDTGVLAVKGRDKHIKVRADASFERMALLEDKNLR